MHADNAATINPGTPFTHAICGANAYIYTHAGRVDGRVQAVAYVDACGTEVLLVGVAIPGEPALTWREIREVYSRAPVMKVVMLTGEEALPAGQEMAPCSCAICGSVLANATGLVAAKLTGGALESMPPQVGYACQSCGHRGFDSHPALVRAYDRGQ